MTVFGWDASDYDWGRGPMNLAAAHSDGISFFTHKATEGTSVRHIHYGAALTRARDAGIPVLGAYHVVRSTGSLADQVKNFTGYLDSATPWWRSHPNFFLQVDLEHWSYDQVAASTGTAFAEQLAAATGHAVIIYASKGQYGSALGGSRPLWNANYPTSHAGGYGALYVLAGGDKGPGWASYSSRVPVFWQYTSSATIGTQPGCDANAYRGSLQQLLALTAPGGVVLTSVTKPLGDNDMLLIRPTGQPGGNDATVWLWSGGQACGLVAAQAAALKPVLPFLDGTMAWADFQSLRGALTLPPVNVDALAAAIAPQLGVGLDEVVAALRSDAGQAALVQAATAADRR